VEGDTVTDTERFMTWLRWYVGYVEPRPEMKETVGAMIRMLYTAVPLIEWQDGSESVAPGAWLKEVETLLGFDSWAKEEANDGQDDPRKVDTPAHLDVQLHAE
jgi:hypothetical protein